MYNLNIDAGATYFRRFTWKIDDVPVDLTGWSARLEIRQYYSDTTPTVSLTSDPGEGIVLGGALGTIEITISAELTDISWSTGVWDIEVVSPDGTVKRLLYGKVTVSPEVTR